MSDWIEPILMMRPLLARSGAVNACVTFKTPSRVVGVTVRGHRRGRCEAAVRLARDHWLPVGGHGVRVGREKIAAGDAGIVHENGYLAEALGNRRLHRAAGRAVARRDR